MRNELFQCLLCDEQSGVFKLLTRLPICSSQWDVDRRRRVVIAKNRVVPPFDVQVRIITGPKQGMNNLPPIGLTEARKSMLSHAGMADAIHLEQLPVNEGVLGVH